MPGYPIKAVTDASFETEVENADTEVLVHFWASWCGECNRITPMLHDVAPKYDKGRIVTMNVHDNRTTPERFIRGIPTLMLFKESNAGAGPSGPRNKPVAAMIRDFSTAKISNFLSIEEKAPASDAATPKP